MNIEYQEFDNKASLSFMRSPDGFRRYLQNFYLTQSDLFMNPGDFAPFPCQSSGAVGEGAPLIDGSYFDCECTECDIPDCFNCGLVSIQTRLSALDGTKLFNQPQGKKESPLSITSGLLAHGEQIHD